jgi:hypothetical protein
MGKFEQVEDKDNLWRHESNDRYMESTEKYWRCVTRADVGLNYSAAGFVFCNKANGQELTQCNRWIYWDAADKKWTSDNTLTVKAV